MENAISLRIIKNSYLFIGGNQMVFIKEKLNNESLVKRILCLICISLILFVGVTILSYYILPEGILKGKTSGSVWDNSNNTIILAVQIYVWNSLSVIVVILASLFGKKRESENNYLSLGYSVFVLLIIMNAVILGTWSFSVEAEAIPLMDRITGMFDIVHRAGILEMMGQLFITCSLARIGIVLTNGKNTYTKKIKEVYFNKQEIAAFVIGIILMMIAAIIESGAINNL